MSQQETTMITCECETEFDSQEEGRFSSIADKFVCESCYGSDLDNSSTVYLINDEVRKFHIGDFFQINEYGDDADLEIEREYIRTDAWRGHTSTNLKNYTTVLDGWTTGGWGDSVADRKALFNEWSAGLIDGDITPPFTIAVVLDPTSNLFSTGVTVQVPSADAEAFKKYFEEELENLHNSLS